MDKFEKKRLTELAKYGGEEGYRAEMRRRAGLRRQIAKGRPFTPETSQQALKKRWSSDGNDSST